MCKTNKHGINDAFTVSRSQTIKYQTISRKFNYGLEKRSIAEYIQIRKFEEAVI